MVTEPSVDKSTLLQMFFDAGVLSFGQFTLKSGRLSPYFFNVGRVFQSQALHGLAHAYAAQLMANFPDTDLLFGPAYKGIPLVSATAVALYERFQRNVGISFDRKEAKDHGEGGLFVGSELGGRVLLIDDVITAGTAVTGAVHKIQSANSDVDVIGLLVALDRQESLEVNGPSAIQVLQDSLGIEVRALLTLEDIVAFAHTNSTIRQHLGAIEAYRNKYGV